MSKRQSYTIGGIKKRHGRLIRTVAVFFVLFTGADLALPQYFCGGEEIGGLPLGSVRAASTEAGDPVTDRSALPAPEAPLPGQDSDQVPHEEDCFCCCAHVLPGLACTAATAGELKTPQPPLEQQSLPSPPLSLQYHPPRFA
jgi:hypothetical protein